MTVRLKQTHRALLTSFILAAGAEATTVQAQDTHTAQAVPANQTSISALVRIMSIWDDGPITPQTRLLLSTAAVLGSAPMRSTDGSVRQVTYLLASSASVYPDKRTLLLLGTTVPEEAKVPVQIVATDAPLGLAVLVAPEVLPVTPTRWATEAIDASREYHSAAFVDLKDVPLSASPTVSGPVATTQMKMPPPGPPVVDVLHGDASATGALLDACGNMAGWHIPPYAFKAVASGTGLAVSSARILAWLNRIGVPTQLGSACSPSPLRQVQTSSQPTDVPEQQSANENAAPKTPVNASQSGNQGTPSALGGMKFQIAIGATVAVLLLVFAFAIRRKSAPARRPHVPDRASVLLQQKQRQIVASEPARTISWRFEGTLGDGRPVGFSVTSSDFDRHRDGLVIGRSPDVSRITIVDNSLSRAHARLSYDGERLLIADLDSTNGVLVNGEHAPPGIHRALGKGDTLQIGNVTLKVAHA